MNILVAGATGDVGSATTKIAVAKGHRVRALIRPTSNKDKLGEVKDKVEYAEGDLLDKASLDRAMEGMEALMIAIRLTPTDMKKGLNYTQVELNGTLNLVEAAKKKGIKKIVFVSVVGAGPKSLSDMYQGKYQAEEAIRNSGIDYTVFKPSGMFKDFQSFHIPTVLKLGETNKWPFGPVDFHMSPVSHVDIAKCMVDSLTNRAASNKTFDIGGPDLITHGDLLNMIAREAGIKANYTEGLTKEQLLEQMKKSPQRSFFTPEQIQDLINDEHIDHSILKRAFGFEFERIADYIKDTVPKVKAAMAKQQGK
jgi:uncharacterized protein YbjT (DUF2867 family)